MSWALLFSFAGNIAAFSGHDSKHMIISTNSIAALNLAEFAVGRDKAAMNSLLSGNADIEGKQDMALLGQEFIYLSRGYALSTTIWDSNDISVCWEDFDASTPNERSWVRNAVADTWEKYSNVRFKGWNQCDNDSNGIRIVVMDIGAATMGLGKLLNGRKNGIILNFTYNNWNSGACQILREWCSKVIAIHEFGHALGFAHEQNRNDTPDTCTKHPQGTKGDITIGAWDLYSVMNYCNPNYNGDGKLSATDIAMVQQFYGAARDVSIDDLPGDQKTTVNEVTFMWSSTGRVEGMDCIQIHESKDPHIWRTNYFCSTKDIGLAWSRAGLIAGMSCTQIHEAADYYTWHNNYLCLPDNSPFVLSWSSSGVMGSNFVRWFEELSPHSWDDNYLSIEARPIKNSPFAISDFAVWAAQPGVVQLSGDFNNDGFDDIALMGIQDYTEGGSIPVAFSKGDGTFKVTNDKLGKKGLNFGMFAAKSAAAVLSGDFNDDGRQDIALIGGAWKNKIFLVAYAQGNSTFKVTNQKPGNEEFAKWATRKGVVSLVGDFNNDGRQDIALVGGKWGGKVFMVAYANSDDGFELIHHNYSWFAKAASQPGIVSLVGDFNNDGFEDIALIGGTWKNNILLVAYANHNGSFEVIDHKNDNAAIKWFPQWASKEGVVSLAGDFNGDQRDDIALLGGAGKQRIFKVAYSQIDGSFRIINYTNKWFGFVKLASQPDVVPVTGDFDNDGRLDIALTGISSWNTLPVAYPSADGSFQVKHQPVDSTFGQWAAQLSATALIGDFNGDQHHNIALIGVDGVRIWGE